MAIVNTSNNEQFAGKIAKDIDLQSDKQSINAAATYLFQVTIDNSANSAKSYVKLYDNALSLVSVGTTEPDFILPVAAESTAEYSFFPGVFFDTGLVAACVTTAGKAGSSNPSSSTIEDEGFEILNNSIFSN